MKVYHRNPEVSRTRSQRQEARGKKVLLPVSALLLLALGLRLWELDADSLWFDTAHSVAVAANDTLAQVVQGAASDYQAPLYFILLHYWLDISQSDWWVRLLSVLAGVGVVGFSYQVGRRLFSPATGVVAALITAISTFQIFYSRYPRAYILVALFILAGLYYLYLALEEGRGRHWALFTLFLGLAIYSHPYALFVVPAEAVFTLAYAWRRRPGVLLPWALSHLVLGLALAPWLWVMQQQYAGIQAGADAWIEPVSAESLVRLHEWVWFRTRLDYGELGNQFLRMGRWALLVVLGLSWLNREKLWEKGLLLLLGLVPVAAAYLVSALGPPLWDPRYLVFVSAPLYVLLGAALAELPWGPWRPSPGEGWPWLRAAALALFLAMSLLPLRSLYQAPEFLSADVRAAATWLREHYQEGDLIVHINYQGYLPSVWYNRQAAGPGPYPIPCVWASMPGSWCQGAPYRETYLDRESSTLAEVAKGAKRVFIVALFDHLAAEEGAKVEAAVAALTTPAGPDESASYEGELASDFRGVKVFSFQRSKDSP